MKRTAKNNFFRGIAIFLMIIMVIFVTSSCDSGNTPEPTPQSVAKPTATPAGGNYTVAQTVRLATSTTGAEIFYTLNGTTPTTSSTYYTSAITISDTATLKAVAVKSGMTDSDVLTEAYTIASSITTPGTPANVTATALSSNSIRITWNAPSSGGTPTYHNIWRSASSTGTYTEIGKVSGSSTSYTDTGLSASTTYYYKVDAQNSAGRSSQSSYAYAMTNSGTTTTPGTPANVTATALSSSSIQITWDSVSGATSYDVYYEIGLSLTKNFAANVTGTSYTHTGLEANKSYWYYIKAKNSAGESAYSSMKGASTPAVVPAAKDITSFQFDDFNVSATIGISSIIVTVPNIVNLTTLAPTIIHNGKSISPASGVAQDFSSWSGVQYTVTADDNTTKTYYVSVTVSNTSLATAFTWLNNNAKSGRTYTIVAQASASMSPVTIDPWYSNVNINLNGGTTEKTVTLSGNGSLFTIRSGTFTLGNNITLQGHSSNNASLVTLNDSTSNLAMNTGSKIINNTATVNYATASKNAIGGGVYIYKGTFTMNGGTISGNRVVSTNSASSSYSNSTVRAMGGGVYIEDGSFIMNNGTITNNSAFSDKFPSAGGGVYVGEYSSGSYGIFTMSGGTISNNTAQSSSILAISYTYGGGAATSDYGRFTMQGGTISGNTVSSADNRLGGGVYVRNDQFRKTGGTINGSPSNTAKDTNSGHAVYARVSSTINLLRNSTAGTSVNMSSAIIGSSGGWE
jgi:hypothetical protein